MPIDARSMLAKRLPRNPGLDPNEKIRFSLYLTRHVRDDFEDVIGRASISELVEDFMVTFVRDLANPSPSQAQDASVPSPIKAALAQHALSDEEARLVAQAIYSIVAARQGAQEAKAPEPQASVKAPGKRRT